MQLVTAIIMMAVAVLPLALAWDEDPRCLSRRRKLASHANSSNSSIQEYPRLAETYHPRLRPIVHNGSVPEISSLSWLLRGSRQREYHRNLEDITTFQLKMYWEEGALNLYNLLFSFLF